MITVGIVSFNKYCNFTNYGSILQTWALHKAINLIEPTKLKSIVIDYCPDILLDKTPLDPIKNMLDQDAESIKCCIESIPEIKENYEKMERFVKENYNSSCKKYTSKNFNEVSINEKIDGFVCGSDTIFCIDEFGFDDGYFANYDIMKNKASIAYAASFGDAHFTENDYDILNRMLTNFKAIGLRESKYVKYVSEKTTVDVEQVIDPTLLLTATDYEPFTTKNTFDKYILVYSRRYDKTMMQHAKELSERYGLKIIDISLRKTYAKNHIMRYDAGVEEFLSLVKYAEIVLTNSFHGMIFSIQFHKDFYIYMREFGDSKISELASTLDVSDRIVHTDEILVSNPIDYNFIEKKLSELRKKSYYFLKKQIYLHMGGDESVY